MWRSNAFVFSDVFLSKGLKFVCMYFIGEMLNINTELANFAEYLRDALTRHLVILKSSMTCKILSSQ